MEGFDVLLEETIGALIIVTLLVAIIILLVAIPTLIGEWKTLKKGGKPGWGALIPFYNTYLFCDMAGVNPWWILIVFLSSFLSGVPLLGLISTVLSIYFVILLNVSLAKAFNKDVGFAIGLMLLPPVFYMILGCGKNNQYVGKNPMKDLLFDTINQKNGNDFSNNQNTENVKYCPSCGTKTVIDTKYCPKCGREMQ